ncbi:pilus assembly protein PilM [candidate division KSB1 bacterium]|nr:pilus assembly protein PilM [candidate division KSB1 bacterium]
MNEYQIKRQGAEKEMNIAIQEVESAYKLSLLDKGSQMRHIVELFKANKKVQDLAMVQGFEGIEKVTHDFETVLFDILSNGTSMEDVDNIKIEYTINALNYLIECNDLSEERETVQDVSEKLHEINVSIHEKEESRDEIPLVSGDITSMLAEEKSSSRSSEYITRNSETTAIGTIDDAHQNVEQQGIETEEFTQSDSPDDVDTTEPEIDNSETNEEVEIEIATSDEAESENVNPAEHDTTESLDEQLPETSHEELQDEEVPEPVYVEANHNASGEQLASGQTESGQTSAGDTWHDDDDETDLPFSAPETTSETDEQDNTSPTWDIREKEFDFDFTTISDSFDNETRGKYTESDQEANVPPRWKEWTKRVASVSRQKSISTAVIGMDIGASSLKIVVLENTEDGLVLKHWRLYEFDHTDFGIVNASKIKMLLADFFEKYPEYKKYPVVTSLIDNTIFVRYVALPKMSVSNFLKSAELDVKSDLFFDERDVDMFTLTYSNHQEITPNEMAGLVLAFERLRIEDTVLLLRKINLPINGLHVDVLAMANLIDEDTTHPVAVIDLGAAKVKIAIVHQGELRFARHIESYDMKLTEEIIDFSGEDARHAEQAKRKIEFKIDKSQPNRLMIQKLRGERGTLENVAFPIISKLADEIQVSIQFYNSNSEDKVERIYLTGGGSLLEGMDDFLETHLNLPVSKLSPFNHIKIQQNSMSNTIIHRVAPRLATAVGIASSFIDKSSPFRLDLRKQIKVKDKARQRIIQAAAVASMALLIFAYGLVQTLKAKTMRYQTQIKEKQIFLDDLDYRMVEMSKYQQLRTELDDQIKELKKLKAQQPAWSQVLKGINQGKLSDLWLTELFGSLVRETQSNDAGNGNEARLGFLRLQLGGATLSANSVQQFIANLEKFPMPGKADFTKISSKNESDNNGISNFQVEGNIQLEERP